MVQNQQRSDAKLYILPFPVQIIKWLWRNWTVTNQRLEWKSGGRNVNNLHYADNITRLLQTDDGLQNLIKRIKGERENLGRRLNFKKAKIVATAGVRSVKTTIDNEDIEYIQKFTCLDLRSMTVASKSRVV